MVADMFTVAVSCDVMGAGSIRTKEEHKVNAAVDAACAPAMAPNV
jgi:hypothetical protein